MGKIAWRLQFGSAFIPSFILLIGIFFCPESPRWLMKHGKHAKGFKSMQILRAHPIIAARDFYYSWVLYEEELLVARGGGYFSRMRDCFTVPRIRRANYGASTVMLAQQMCGINSKSYLVSCTSVRPNTLQSSLSIARLFSKTSATQLPRPCMPPWAMVLYRLYLRSLLCSLLIPKDEEP